MVISMSRILRCFVCFLLIGCILVNCSPIRAKAVTVEGVMVNAFANAIFDSILRDVGISPGSDSSIFDGLINQCRDAISAIYPVSNGFLKVFKYYRAGSDPLFGVPIAMVEAVRNWSYDSKVVVSRTECPVTVSDDWAFAYASAAKKNLAFWYHQSSLNRYVIVCSDASYWQRSGGYIYFYNDAACTDTAAGQTYITSWASCSKAHVQDNPIHWFGTAAASQYSTYDVTLGTIGARDEQFDLAYPDWYADAVTVPGSVSGSDEDEEYVPITLPDSAIGSDSDTDIGTGSGTGTGSGSDVGTGSDTGTSTGTIADVITNIKSLGVSFADSIAEVVASVKAIPAAIADIFTPSAEIGHFALDLKNFFPFCIPFDLYDFFVCLNADPVAPVIDWEIYLPGGDTYPLKLDLAVFDDVAQLLRTLQLLLFCVGLAAKTRDLIKG